MKSSSVNSKDIARYGTMAAREVLHLQEKEEELGRKLTPKEIEAEKKKAKEE